MDRFLEAMCAIIIILLAYIILRQEKYINFSQAVAAKDFNFKNDIYGNTGADEFLKTKLNY